MFFSLSPLIHFRVRLMDVATFDVAANLFLENAELVHFEAVSLTRSVVGREFVGTARALCDGNVQVCVNGGSFTYEPVCASVMYAGCLVSAVQRE